MAAAGLLLGAGAAETTGSGPALGLGAGGALTVDLFLSLPMVTSDGLGATNGGMEEAAEATGATTGAGGAEATGATTGAEDGGWTAAAAGGGAGASPATSGSAVAGGEGCDLKSKLAPAASRSAARHAAAAMGTRERDALLAASWDIGTTGGGVRFVDSASGTEVRVGPGSVSGRCPGAQCGSSSRSVRSGEEPGTVVGALVSGSTSVSGP